MTTDDIFQAVMDLHEAKGLPPLNEVGVWGESLPDGWYMAINGKRESVKVTPPNGMEAEVPPFTLVAWFNGWLAGSIHPVAGGVLAAGEAANEDTFVEAIRKARRGLLQ